MSDNTQMQFRSEGQPAFQEDKETDNSTDSSTDQTNTDQTQSQEGDQNSGAQKEDGGAGSRDSKSGLNNPTVERWQEREADWKNRFNSQEERHAKELTALREEFDKRFNEVAGSKGQPTSSTPSEVPAWFGGDEEQWSSFQEWNKTLIAQAREEAVKEITSKGEEEQKRIDEATKYFNDEVTAIETDKDLNPQGDKVDRNKLLKKAMDEDLVDSKGRWNYRAAFKMMKPSEVFAAKQALKDRKDIANATTSENRAETKPPEYSTSETFKSPGSRPW